MASSSSRLLSPMGRFSSISPSPPSSSSLPAAIKDGECTNWAELPSELMSSIMQRLSVIEILENAQKVCKSWHRVSKGPSIWRKIDMRNVGDSTKYDVEIMCRHAVDRSQGGLVEIEIWYFCTDSLLKYLSDRSRNLRSLKLAKSYITEDGFAEAVMKFPLLEELEVSYCTLPKECLKVVGKSCPNLKILKLNRDVLLPPRFPSDDDALAIAETMHGLRHLQLFGNRLSYTGLNAILDNCPNLEHLDLRYCLYVDLVGDVGKRCSERIKVVRHPDASTHDYPFDATAIVMDSLDGEDSYSDDLSGDSDNSDYNPYDPDSIDYFLFNRSLG